MTAQCPVPSAHLLLKVLEAGQNGWVLDGAGDDMGQGRAGAMPVAVAAAVAAACCSLAPGCHDYARDCPVVRLSAAAGEGHL